MVKTASNKYTKSEQQNLTAEPLAFVKVPTEASKDVLYFHCRCNGVEDSTDVVHV